MTIDADDDILQDFLVEAGEILEQLGEQLVELEQRPQDNDLLNAVFRGFHTVKGGASFLNLTALVNVCHRAEDVFNVLRQGERQVDADLMDAVLRVLDILNDMFAQVRGGEEPSDAPEDLLQQLEQMAVPGGDVPAQEQAGASVLGTERAAGASEPAQPGEGDISDNEFEALLNAVGDDSMPAPPGEPAGSESTSASDAHAGDDEITDDEFEALLDQLHGKGQHGGVPSGEVPPAGSQPATPVSESANQVGAQSDEITEEEFEALLDQLHGKGKHGGAPVQEAVPAAATSQAAPQPKPEGAPSTRETPAAAAKPAASTGKAKDTAPKSASAPAQADTTVRVDTKRLDDIMNLVGELVLVRNRLATLKATMADEHVAKAVGNLDVVTADLQSAVMKTRMQPIKKVFGRFPRVVRDLARSLKKEVNLELRGEETDLDKNLVEALADPLVHLVRNAVDHGIELPDERESAGKPRAGHVVLSAAQEGDHILLTISDDGKGMDPDVLRRKAIEKGLMDEEAASRLSDHDAYNLIFMAGFSTKEQISDVSGRGVGMDVVKTRITQLNGSVEIDSVKGQGSTLRIKVPLTLAILPTLMVVLGEQRFALPLASVKEIFNLDLSRTNVVDGREVVMVRDRALPLFYLRRWLVTDVGEEPQPETCHVVVVTVGNQYVGFVVDQLIGQEEVVIKPLGAMLQGVAGLAGATITGDGRIALILDVPSLMGAYGRRF